jgi:hypothetical protein
MTHYVLSADPRVNVAPIVTARDLSRPSLTVRERAALAADIATGRARLALTRNQIAWLTRTATSTIAAELRRRNGGAR